MSNPIFSSFNNTSQTQQEPSLFELFNQIRNSRNPNAAMQNLVSHDPRFQGMMKYIQQNGGDAKTAFYNLAVRKGIDPNTILTQLK